MPYGLTQQHQLRLVKVDNTHVQNAVQTEGSQPVELRPTC